MPAMFISGTSTGVGKTWLTRGLARALVRRGVVVAAVKPFETGCEPDPEDALALARACGRPILAHTPGFYRTRRPLAPWAATLEGAAAPDPSAIVDAIRGTYPDDGIALVEGAGGLFVPVDADRDMADLARSLGIPVVLAAHDGLGVLSDTLATHGLAAARGVRIAAIVLTSFGPSDPSCDTNARILRERLPCPVLRFPAGRDDDDALADAAAPLLGPLGLSLD